MMKVEIWADVSCPWCYIGKRRFETALGRFEHRDEVRVIWRSFELDPHAPRKSDLTASEVLSRKYGMSAPRAAAEKDRVTQIAAGEGLEYHLEIAKYGNTFDAHRLVHLAATRQLQDEMEERLFRAYFTEGAQLADVATLEKLAVEVGIEKDEARAVLQGDGFALEVRQDIERAASFGVQGVPFFAIDERYGVSGAQPTEFVLQALNAAWAEVHARTPKVTSPGQHAGRPRKQERVP